MNILYGVPSEGMGHATRSKVLIAELLKEHNVQVVTSDRAFTFLDESFPGHVHEIKGFHFAYKNAAVTKWGTLKQTLKTAPENLITNFHKYRELHTSFQPDIVISDFESFSYFFAKYHNLPIISVDNMQAINRGQMDILIPENEKGNHRLSKNIVKIKVPDCNHYFITSFFPFELQKPDTTIVPPIIREQIIRAEPKRGEHILVYQTSATQKNLVHILNEVKNEQFHLYGFNRSEIIGNVTLMPFSEERFVEDLAGARAIIANGGFSLLSEAVYLGKPVCSFPIRSQFEQYLNAAYIDKLGYGRNFAEFTPDAVKAFIYDIPQFSLNLKSYKQDGNSVLYEEIGKYMAGLNG
jgi:uncharacterized protein (TIGR00661 family)